MYPLGFLFGLGFDTATEIGLIGISAAEASKGLPIWSILVFPALFTAGMALVDTTDSVLMVGAYGWAFLKPIRKLYYNMTITAVSIIVALVVGRIETLGLIGSQLNLTGRFWRYRRPEREFWHVGLRDHRHLRHHLGNLTRRLSPGRIRGLRWDRLTLTQLRT